MPADRRRQKKEQRAKRLEAERKKAARRELARRLINGLGFGLVVALALIFLSSRGSNQPELPEAYLRFRERPTACGADAPPPERLMTFEAPQPNQVPPGATATATIQTSCGPIVIELDPAGYPQTVNSFVFLSRRGFYDGTVFHRVVEDFLIQGGDPQADGTGGPGYTVPDEWPPEGFTYERGVVAMWNSGRDTTGSQFFVAIGPEAGILAPRFNVLGKVVDGFDTLDAIARIKTARQAATVEESLPLEAIYIEHVEITIGE